METSGSVWVSGRGRVMKLLIVVLVLVTVTVFGIVFARKLGWFSSPLATTQNSDSGNGTGQVSRDNLHIEVPDGWKLYQNDVFGVVFVYPESWGEPYTSPLENITHLSGLEQDFERQNTAFYNSFSIGFKNNTNVSLTVFNDAFIGVESPYGYAYPMDNISVLKKSGNICDYHLEFTSEDRRDTIQQVVDTCQQGIKTILTEERSFGYTYRLRAFGYHVLMNGYFDYLLVEADFGSIGQEKNQITSVDEFYSHPERWEGYGNKVHTKEEIEIIKNQLVTLVGSIQSYIPPKQETMSFEVAPGEDPNVTTIRKYYWLVSMGKLQEAYAMYENQKNVSYDTFLSWYQNVYFAKPDGFKKTSDKQYEFSVQYQEHNADPTEYRVVMKVTDGKIETKSAVEILSKAAVFGEYKAYVAKRRNKNFVILVKNGKEEIVDQGDAEYTEDYRNMPDVKFFSDVQFSPNGQYLIYVMYGWEWSVGYVYDVKNKKVIFTQDSPGAMLFSQDNKYFISCAASAFSGTFNGLIFKSNDFTRPVFDIEKYESNIVRDYEDIKCTISNTDVHMYLNNDNWEGEGKDQKPANKTIIYSLVQNKVED